MSHGFFSPDFFSPLSLMVEVSLLIQSSFIL